MSTANLDSADLKSVAVGGLINEDVMSKIWDISRIPLPFTDLIGTDTCRNSYKEWTLDALQAPNLDNAVVDGSDASGNDTAVGVRVGNHCQISRKVVRVSTRARASDTIGRSDELAYQLMRRQQELKRDLEAISLSNQASVADNGDAVPGRAGALGAWLETNTSRGTAGADGGFNTGTSIVDAPTAGEARGLTETLIRDMAQSIYAEGGDASVLMSVPSVIRGISEFLFTSSARVATVMADQGKSRDPAVALGTINVFVTDFGTLRLIPNRLQQTYESADQVAVDVANVYFLDPMYLSMGFLHGFRTEDLAKTGLADNRMMNVDWTLICKTERAHGVIADIDPTVAVVQ